MRILRTIAWACASVALVAAAWGATPRTARAQADHRPAARETRETRDSAPTASHRTLVATGTTALATGYVMNAASLLLVASGAFSLARRPPDHPEWDESALELDQGAWLAWTALPVAGPFAQAAMFPPEHGLFAYHLAAGATQAAGLVALVVGLAWRRPAREALVLLPGAAPGGGGVHLRARF